MTISDDIFVCFHSFQSYEEDNNRDGKKDILNFEIQIPLKDTESIHSVQLILIFDYKLHVSNYFILYHVCSLCRIKVNMLG